MQYAELYAAIQSFTENTFPSTVLADGGSVTTKTQIDTFIKQAEQRIYNSAQLPASRKDSTLTLTANSPVLEAPADFLSVFSAAVIDDAGAYSYLLVKDPNFIREAYPDPAVVGIPRYYAIQGKSSTVAAKLAFILGPTPQAAYSLALQYYAYPESIVTSNSSWLGDNFDTVLLYGCLLEAAVFMKAEADTLTTYGARYQEALAQMKQLVDGKERGDTYRNGQVKVSVT